MHERVSVQLIFQHSHIYLMLMVGYIAMVTWISEISLTPPLHDTSDTGRLRTLSEASAHFDCQI